MSFNIVLVEPEIPNNTGNVGRLSLASGSKLHLIKPFGFELNDARVKRAGLDYWKFVNIQIYESIEEFYTINKGAQMVYLSSHANKLYTDIPFEKNLFLVFGKESKGLSNSITNSNLNKLYKIPILSEHVRSLNLANSVGIVVFEGLRVLSHS